MQGQTVTISRTLEAGLTFFSAAEIRVVLLPVGEIPDDVFARYAALIMAHRQVELNNVRSFYKESQKSPFKFFPWKTGNMHFRFLPEDAATQVSPLAPLHNHRRVLGVLGVISCPHTPDVARRYKEFEQQCRAFPDASTIRCFAFDPSDAQITEDHRSRPDLILFPPGPGGDHLINHMEVVMHDFAACVLGALERWMLNASPAMAPMASLVDTPEFTGATVAPYAGEDEASRTKRKYARLQKAMGDYSLLAGSPLDALDHYNTAAELGRATSDLTFTAAALEGYASAKLLHAAVANDAFVSNASSVFINEDAWRRSSDEVGSVTSVTPQSATPPPDKLAEAGGDGAVHGGGIDGENGVAAEVALPQSASPLSDSTGGLSPHVPTKGPESVGDMPLAASPRSPHEGQDLPSAALETGMEQDGFDNDTASTGSGSGPAAPFQGRQFWDALRRSDGLEEEVRALVEESKASIRKRGGLPLLVESDMKWARLRAGLHGKDARAEASELAAAIQAAAELLPLPEDRLVALTEAATILGSVGAVRKRVLLMWQAVELSKFFGFPDTRTLAVARQALEPAVDASNAGGDSGDEWHVSARPLSQETAVPESWGLVRAGCLEATLGLAIYAKRHGDVWDAAAALLRDHASSLSPHRMQSLLENLVAAASQMTPAEKARPGRGPPPLLLVWGPRPLPTTLQPVRLVVDPSAVPQSPAGRQGLFLYDPFAAKRKLEKAGSGDPASESEAGTVTEWVCGEMAVVDIEVSNPSSVSIKIDKMVLEAELNGVPATKAVWKAKPVSINIPAYTKPVRIQLEGTPLAPGTLVLTGCRLTAFGGVSWTQPWSQREGPTAARLAAAAAGTSGSTHAGSGASVKMTSPPTVTVLPALPRVELSLAHKGTSAASPGPPPPPTTPRKATAPAEASIAFLHGQTVETALVINNSGATPVGMARVKAVECGRLRVDVDGGALAAALPLAPGSTASIPVRISVADPAKMLRSGTDGSTTVTLELDYSCGDASSPAPLGGSADANLVVGRRAVMEVGVTVLPSIHVASVSFREVFVPGDSMDAAGGKAADERLHESYERCVLMGVEVVNRGPKPLEVWLERSESSNSFCDAGHRVQMASEHRAEVTMVIKPGAGAGAASAAMPAAGSTGTAPAQSSHRGRVMKREEVERHTCAAWLSQAAVLRFLEAQAGEGAAPGALPLVQGEVYNGLGLGVLSMLRPCAATACVSISPAGAADPFPVHLVPLPSGAADGGGAVGGTGVGSGIPAAHVGVGQTLQVRFEIVNSGAEPIVVCGALAAHPVAAAERMGHEQWQARDEVWPETAAGGSLVAWTGVHSRLRLEVGPGGRVEHVAGLSIAAQGLWRVALVHVGCDVAGGAAPPAGWSPLVGVRPCFVNVIAGDAG